MVTNRLKALALGVLFFPLRRFFKTEHNLWLFSADEGRKYAQNSRYLYEYVLKEHPEINAYWITQSDVVYKQLKGMGKPVVKNLSIKGIVLSLSSELKLVSTWFNDILYTFPYQNVAYLHHGMPIKKIFYDNQKNSNRKYSFIDKLKSSLTKLFLYNYKLEYSCYTPVTSDYYKSIISRAMRNPNVLVEGQPRTDAFLHLDNEQIRKKLGIDKDALVVTYMPTHRSYGLGNPPPHVFIDNSEATRFFQENNILLVWKQHINMLKKYQHREAPNCFKEMSFDFTVDPQELLFVSDILITDWSSCFIDYMLLKKPILFYHYDDYEKEDNDVYFGADKLAKVGMICKTEEQLLSGIKQSLDKHNAFVPNISEWRFFNEFYDDKSSERSFKILYKMLNQ